VNVVTDRKPNGDFTLAIEKCTQNPSLVGTVLEEPMTSFASVAKMVFPNSDSKVWK